MKNTTKSQEQRIKEYLQNGNVITPMTALTKFGCFRLGARIWNLQHKHGMAIKSELVHDRSGKRYARYSLA